MIAGAGRAPDDERADGGEEHARLLGARGADAEERPRAEHDGERLERGASERAAGEGRAVEPPEEEREVDGEQEAGADDGGALARREAGGSRAGDRARVEQGERDGGEGDPAEGEWRAGGPGA